MSNRFVSVRQTIHFCRLSTGASRPRSFCCGAIPPDRGRRLVGQGKFAGFANRCGVSRSRLLQLLLTFAFLTAFLGEGAQAGTPRFARLGAFEGSVEVQLDPADPWRPAVINLPLSESARIRTGPAAKLEIELDDTSVFRMTGEGLAELSDYTRLSGGQRITVISLDRGVAYFTGEPGVGGAVHLLVPGAQASLKQGSRIRLLALDTSSEIAIIEGAVRLTMPSAEMDFRHGQSARVTVPDSTHFSLYREIAPLDSDGWSEQLDKAEASAPASRLDLDHGGKWLVAGDFGTVWQPAPKAGWAPFREGRWMWVRPLGFTWVAAEPWGWKPYHEGRWLQHSDLGWVWVPEAKNAAKNATDFSPGDVFWARTSALATWGPLAPGEQWNGAGPPRQFAAFNMTGGSFVSGAREILPSPPEELPKDLLKVLLFTAALPSPPLPLARLNATRDALRTRLYSAVEVAPAVPVITEVIPPPPPPEPEAPVNTVAATPVINGDPVIAPDPIQGAPPDNRPIVPGIIVLTGPNKARNKSQDKNSANQAPAKTTTYVVPVMPVPTLNGAGSASLSRLYESWTQRFKDVQFNYQAIGAGASLKQLRQGLIDFAATDSFLPETQNSRPRSGDTNAPFLHFPSAVNAVVVIYNAPGINESLKLTPELLGAIYMGEIRYWNDFRIMAINPRANVPPTNIILVNHAASSAATLTFTDYLSKVNPLWKERVGSSTSITWPITGLSATSDDDVARLVHDTPYSLGYVNLAEATKFDLRYAALRNHAGHFVSAQPETMSAAASSSIRTEGVIADFRKSITDAPGDQSYPIASLTYLLVPRTISDPLKRAALSAFLKWMLTEGQKQATNFQFAPLPKEFVANEQQQISLIKPQ